MAIRLTLDPDGISVISPSGEALIDLIDEHESLSIPLGCRSSHCGSCLVRVTRGAALLNPPSAWERETLERFTGAEDARLGCAIVLDGEDGEVVLERLPAG